MIGFNKIRSVAVAVTAVCALFLTSCVNSEVEMSVSVTEDKVSFEKGHVFIDVKYSGNWTLYLVSQEGGDVDWARIEDGKDSGTGNASLIVLYYDKNKGTDSRTLKIVLDNGLNWKECQLEQGCEILEQEPEASDPIVGEGLAKTGWMELPALDDQSLEYYSHDFSMNGKTYRNYSFGWSQKDFVAVWVAYPLCRLYLNGSVGRTDAWALDPLLDKKSAAPFGGYAEELARGHQLPSADRQCCYEANAQTFYGTNMTPQLNEHNEGIWSKLEGRVRTYAETSDTTYVVTGVVLEGSKRKTRDSNGNTLTVPAAYFKAILKYSTQSTYGKWNAVAFYLEHRAYSENIGKQHSMSIDELEKITGIDFFVNLPAKVGDTEAAKIEAADPTAVGMWW